MAYKHFVNGFNGGCIMRSNVFMWSLALVVHLVLFGSVFDVYYRSPVIQGIQAQFRPTGPPPAKRLVLFVADGLRAHSLFRQYPTHKTQAPFLRSVMESVGRWGVSHTRVPTESRPGHVALIAGLYEDVSAVTRGWQENPVHFDSVFNQSTHTFAWGSPDILPMFAKGAVDGKVRTFMYSAEEEDFASGDASKLDTWVFDNVQKFFTEAKSNTTLAASLDQPGVVFFLHLLGLDTTGHGQKPGSRAYHRNIDLVDEGVRKIQELIGSYYKDDGQTTYLFTADHGMTDWGSHGTGDDHETMTPLILWGAGVKSPELRPVKKAAPPWLGEISEPIDVEQADIAPLMATILGLNFPKNSVGRLPRGYLNTSLAYQYSAAVANWDQVWAQFYRKRAQTKEHSFSALFREYTGLAPQDLSQFRAHIDEMGRRELYETGIELCMDHINKVLDGILYFHRYARPFQSASIVLVFATWIYLSLELAHLGDRASLDFGICRPPKWALVLSAIIWSILRLNHMPWSLHIYCLLPIYLLTLAINLQSNSSNKSNSAGAKQSLRDYGVVVVLCIFGCELLVWSFFHRWLLSLGLWVLSLWPLASYNPFSNSGLGRPQLLWFATCLALSIFPLLPTVGGRRTQFGLVVACGLFLAAISVLAFWKLRNRTFLIAALFHVAAAGIIWTTSQSVAIGQGLGAVSQFLSWTLLALSLIVPLWTRPPMFSRVLLVYLFQAVIYLLLSMSYEALFYIILAFFMLQWINLELPGGQQNILNVQLTPRPRNFSSHISPQDIRRAFFVLYFVMLAFFGTGNIASLNGFNPSSVQCFVTVFRPFTMGALLLVKVTLPFLLVTLALRLIHNHGPSPSHSPPMATLFLLLLTMSDFMAGHFFFLLRESGSWLDIGTSISHYVISISISLVLILMSALTHIYLGLTPTPSPQPLPGHLPSKTHLL